MNATNRVPACAAAPFSGPYNGRFAALTACSG